MQLPQLCVDASQTITVDLVKLVAEELGGHGIAAELVGTCSTLLVQIKHITNKYATTTQTQFKQAEREIAEAELCFNGKGEPHHPNIIQLSGDKTADTVFMHLSRILW